MSPVFDSNNNNNNEGKIKMSNQAINELQKVNVTITHLEEDYFGKEYVDVCKFSNRSTPHTEGKYTKVWADNQILPKIWAGFNAGSGQEMNAFLKADIRSLCIGDKVTIEFEGESHTWTCERKGWSRELCIGVTA